MKKRIAHLCPCGSYVAEWRSKMPPFCPDCKRTDLFDTLTVEVITIEAADFPKKDRCLPGQTDFQGFGLF